MSPYEKKVRVVCKLIGVDFDLMLRRSKESGSCYTWETAKRNPEWGGSFITLIIHWIRTPEGHSWWEDKHYKAQRVWHTVDIGDMNYYVDTKGERHVF